MHTIGKIDTRTQYAHDGRIGMIEHCKPHRLLVQKYHVPTLFIHKDQWGRSVMIRFEVQENLGSHWRAAVEARAAHALQPLAAHFGEASLRLTSQPANSGASLRYCCEFSARNAAGATWHFKSLNEDPLVAIDDTIARVRRTATRFRATGRQ